MNIQVQAILKVIREASSIVLSIYNQESRIKVEVKSDSSPVTRADKQANNFIVSQLEELYPESNFITEEADLSDYSIRRDWEYTWIIDPLDGTKEFINRNGEFTINIALAKGSEIVFGVIMIPPTGVIYYAEKGKGAFKIEDGQTTQIQARKPSLDEELIVLTSRSHRSSKIENFVEENYSSMFQNIKYQPAGSSLKMCLVAEGRAHLYPRLGTTMEWDIAAGAIIAQEAGAIVEAIDGKPLKFNKEDLRNPSFIVRSFSVEDI